MRQRESMNDGWSVVPVLLALLLPGVARADGVDSALGALFTLVAIVAVIVYLFALGLTVALFKAVSRTGGDAARVLSLFFGALFALVGLSCFSGVSGGDDESIILGLVGLAISAPGAALLWNGFRRRRGAHTESMEPGVREQTPEDARS